MAEAKRFPVVKAVAYALAHTPGLLEHGSKPQREIARDPGLQAALASRFRSYEEALDYPPNRVYLGSMPPEALWSLERPWWKNRGNGASRFGRYGEIMPEAECYGLLRFADEFGLVWLESGFLASVGDHLSRHPLMPPQSGARFSQSKARRSPRKCIQNAPPSATRSFGLPLRSPSRSAPPTTREPSSSEMRFCAF